MKVIGTDKNGDEIAEVSVTELDTMFKEIRNMAIDECIRIIEETVWKDTDMLVESIRELKGVRNDY